LRSVYDVREQLQLGLTEVKVRAEASAPEKLAPGGEQEMNPISWTPFLREAGEDRTIPRPERYDPRSFEDWRKAPPWVDWDGSGGIYNPAGWCFYTHRRMVDRHHLKLPEGTEAVILNRVGRQGWFAATTTPCPHLPLIEPDGRVSRIRLSEAVHRFAS
jgi:hypothetical protein